MNYEKKYKEALERAKEIIECSKSDTKEVRMVLSFFPELAESEGERIRNFLIDLIKACGWTEKKDQGWPLREECIAWLEKQGEQKSLDYPYVTGWRKNYKDNKPKVKHSVLMYTTHGIAEGEWLGEEWCQYRWSCKIKDEDVLYWLHLSDLENLEKENVEQKSVEWSKEDENNILFLTSIIEECFKDKEKITLCGDTVCANFTKENVIDRLKSLRPQSQWKPSEEQMRALNEVVNYAANHENMHWNDYIFGTLNGLVKQLKNLTE